tara:strand:- start:116 stop:1090 length:975 start_codon:yes stop_codon:yes gene_type:complete
MSKDMESLTQSRELRKNLVAEWGIVPGSVWRVNWSKTAKDDSKTYGDFKNEQTLKHGTKAFSLSSAGHGKEGGLSRFPQDLCRFLMTFYSSEGGTVLDPFAGHNSRMESCFRTGRNYIGFDVCEEFMGYNETRREELLATDKQSMFPVSADIKLVKADSRTISQYVEPEMADCSVTSPPFWDVEYYGPEPEQLGLLTYPKFMEAMTTVAGEVYKCLKPNGFIAWEVNDFRRDGVFIEYHVDTIKAFKEAGFRMHDVIIVDYGAAFLKSFLTDVDYLKVMPKQHAYIIVGRKPGVKDHGRKEHRDILLTQAESRPMRVNEQIGLV